WNGWVKYGNNTIDIVKGEGVNGSSCLRVGYEHTSPMNQVGLFKWLGLPGSKELYIRWYFRFDDRWRWGNGQNGSMVYFKTLRIGQNRDLNNLNGKSPNNTTDYPSGLVFNWQDDCYGSFSPHVYAKFVYNTPVPVPACPSDGNGPPCNINKWWRPTTRLGQLETYTGEINSLGYFVNNGLDGNPSQTFHSIEHHIRLRDRSDTPNAIYEVWIDGQKIGPPDDLYKSNPYVSAEGGLMNWITLADNGTGGQFWPDVRYLYIDNFVISTTPIGQIPPSP
ncbi:MAG: hypothetical protein GY869_12600, partial [Planctomycetes bacterium]|nr:hypothetical protein [Planctomycetota bacterium]